MVASLLQRRAFYVAVLGLWCGSTVAMRMDELRGLARESAHPQADDANFQPDAYLQQDANAELSYRPNQTLVDSTLGTVKQYLKFVTGEQLKVKSQVEGMERAFQVRLNELQRELQQEIKAGNFKPDQRLVEAKATLDSDDKVAKNVFKKCKAKAKEEESMAAKLLADIKQCKELAQNREEKEKVAMDTMENNGPRKERELLFQDVVYAKLEELERLKSKWSAKLEEAEIKAKSAFNLAAQADASLRNLIESRDRLERERSERLNELKRAVDEAENISVGTGVEHAGTVGIAKDLAKSSDDVLTDADHTEQLAGGLLSLLGDVKGAIDKLYATGPSNLGMTTEEFFDFEDEIYNAFSSDPADVTGVNIDDWKETFESMRSEKEQVLVDIGAQVKLLVGGGQESLLAKMRGIASNTPFTGQVLPLLDDVQKAVSQAASTQTAAACRWYTDVSYGPSEKNPAVLEVCTSLGVLGTGGASLLQAKVAVSAKTGSKATAKTTIVASPALAKSLGELQSVLTAAQFEMQSRRVGLEISGAAKGKAISEAEEGDQNKQAKAEEQARRQELLDEEWRRYLAWSNEQDEEIAKIDHQLAEKNAAAAAAKSEFEEVKAKVQELQADLDWHNEPDQVAARKAAAATHNENYMKLELEDSRVNSEFIAAAEAVSDCAENVLEMGLLNTKKLQQDNVDKTADQKAAEALQQKDAAAQAEKKCKSDFREARNQIERDYRAKQDELEVARSINDVQRVKLLEYKDTLDKCSTDYSNVLALSLQVEEYHVQVLDPYYASLTALQTGLGVLLFDALENDSFASRTPETDRLAKKTPMSESELVQLATKTARATAEVLSKGEAIKQKLDTWVPIFEFDSRSQMQGKMDVLLDDVRKTEPMSMTPLCKWYSLYHLKQDTMLGYEDCLQMLKRSEAKTTEETDPLSDLESAFEALSLEDK